MPKETWVKSRRIVINGHPTSLRLEPEFWYWLREIGAECGISATKLIAAINTARNPDRSLSSALRVAVAGYYHNAAPRYGLVDPSSRRLFGLSARASLATAPKEQQAKPALDENFLAGLDRARTLTPEIGTRKTLARKTPAAGPNAHTRNSPKNFLPVSIAPGSSTAAKCSTA